MTSSTARRGERSLGVATDALSGPSAGVRVGRTILALTGSRGGRVSSVATRRAARRDGRVSHSADFDRLDK